MNLKQVLVQSCRSIFLISFLQMSGSQDLSGSWITAFPSFCKTCSSAKMKRAASENRMAGLPSKSTSQCLLLMVSYSVKTQQMLAYTLMQLPSIFPEREGIHNVHI